MLRRWPAILAAFMMLMLGSGALVALHELQHDLDRQSRTQDAPPAAPHDDSNCPVHAMLHAPALAGGVELPLLGLAETTEVAGLADQLVVTTDFTCGLSCRGPPVL